jgi:hypothetical protein
LIAAAGAASTTGTPSTSAKSGAQPSPGDETGRRADRPKDCGGAMDARFAIWVIGLLSGQEIVNQSLMQRAPPRHRAAGREGDAFGIHAIRAGVERSFGIAR